METISRTLLTVLINSLWQVALVAAVGALAVELSLAAARRERGPARSPGFASAVFSVWTAECLPALPALPADSPGAGVDSNGPDSRQRVPKEDARPDGVGRNPVPGGAR